MLFDRKLPLEAHQSNLITAQKLRVLRSCAVITHESLAPLTRVSDPAPFGAGGRRQEQAVKCFFKNGAG